MQTRLLPLLALAAIGYVVYEKTRGVADVAQVGVPQPLRAGVRYLFLVRLDASMETAQAVLAPKGVERIEFSPATVPPFWAAPGAVFSTSLVSFIAQPAGNGTVTVGEPFYGIGRLERVVRLDGQPFSAPAGEG